LAVMAILGSADTPGLSNGLLKMLVVGAYSVIVGVGVYYLVRTSSDR
jgi:hypothetical protein